MHHGRFGILCGRRQRSGHRDGDRDGDGRRGAGRGGQFSSQLTHPFLQRLIPLQRLHVTELQLSLILQHSLFLVLPRVTLVSEGERLSLSLLSFQMQLTLQTLQLSAQLARLLALGFGLVALQAEESVHGGAEGRERGEGLGRAGRVEAGPG